MDHKQLEQVDAQAQKLLADFVPDKVFDTHTHIYHEQFTTDLCANKPNGPFTCYGWERYLQDMQRVLPGRTIHANMIPYPDKHLAVNKANRQASDEFTVAQLEKDPLSVGEIIVAPGDTAEELEKRLIHPRIRGFKCYYLLARQTDDTRDCDPQEFLPEGAWELADSKGLVITLHLTKPDALADPINLAYVRTMAKRFPHAILILAHAARSYASWPGVESAEQIADLDNVWLDFSAIFHSPPAFQFIKKAGISRCMWGTDFPICNERFTSVSLGRDQYWLGEKMQQSICKVGWDIATQTLMAIREACIMADLTKNQIEDLFYNNAMSLFHGK